MTAHAIITGSLFRDPKSFTSRAGKPFVGATVKVKNGEQFEFWRVTAFSESACAELSRLGDGDALSVQGAMKAEIYRPESGEPRINLSLIADAVLALRQPKKSRARAAGEPNEPRRHSGSAEREQRPSEPRRPAQSRERSIAEQAANGGERFMKQHGGGVHPELNDDLPW